MTYLFTFAKVEEIWFDILVSDQSLALLRVLHINQVKGKGKVFPYSLPSVGPGADPGVQAVSPQVT